MIGHKYNEGRSTIQSHFTSVRGYELVSKELKGPETPNKLLCSSRETFPAWMDFWFESTAAVSVVALRGLFSFSLNRERDVVGVARHVKQQ